MPVEPGSAVRCVWVTHAERLSRRMPRRAGCPIQRSSPHCRRAKRLRSLTSLPMTWALRRTPSGRPAQASQPTTLRKLGQRNGSGSGYTSLPPSVNSFSMINNAGVPFVGTSSTTDLKPVTHPLSRCVCVSPAISLEVDALREEEAPQGVATHVRLSPRNLHHLLRKVRQAVGAAYHPGSSGWVNERREQWDRVSGPDGGQRWIKAADLRPKEGDQLSLVGRPSVQTQIFPSSALKASKQCLRVVGWLPMHHHRRLLAARWQCSSTLFRWRPLPLLERHHPSADERPPRAGERRASLLLVQRSRCRPKPETDPAP
jgi:hypothetical protein